MSGLLSGLTLAFVAAVLTGVGLLGFVFANWVPLQSQQVTKVNRPKKIGPPTDRVVFQPVYYWLGREPTYQGTGFFAHDPFTGDVVAVSSSHYFDFDGPLREVIGESVQPAKQ